MADKPARAPFKYECFTLGDINGFFGLVFGNMTVLSFLAGIMIIAFGIIHSAIPDGNMYLPWTLSYPADQMPCRFTLGYLSQAALLLVLSFSKEVKEGCAPEYCQPEGAPLRKK